MIRELVMGALFGALSWRNGGKGGLIDTDILTVADLAATLKQPEEKIHELLESGTLPGRRVGDAWYVTRRQLLAYIEGADVRAPRPKSTLGGKPNIFPFGEWRCTSCDKLNGIERAECAECGAVRRTPLMGFRKK